MHKALPFFGEHEGHVCVCAFVDTHRPALNHKYIRDVFEKCCIAVCETRTNNKKKKKKV